MQGVCFFGNVIHNDIWFNTQVLAHFRFIIKHRFYGVFQNVGNAFVLESKLSDEIVKLNVLTTEVAFQCCFVRMTEGNDFNWY